MLPGTTNKSLNTPINAVKPSNFTRSPFPPVSTRYDPAPPPDPIKLQLENSLKQYQPKPATPQPKPAYKPILPRVDAIQQPIPPTAPTAPKPHQFNPADYGKSPKFNPADYAPKPPSNPTSSAPSRSPLMGVKNPGVLSESFASAVKSFKGFKPGLGEVASALDLLGKASLKAQGIDGPTNSRDFNQRLRDYESLSPDQQLIQTADGIKDDLDRFPRNLRDAFDNLFDQLADPFKRHPRTDPKNDDRPKPQRYATDWRGFKFWSPANGGITTFACPKGEYELGATYPRNDAGGYRYSSPDKRFFQVLTYELLLGDQQVGYSSRIQTEVCEPDTIEPDPTYIPPQIDLPVLTPPGTIPDPGYPPVFTENDFKPQKRRNDDQAKQDEADRQSAPAPEQQREAANEADHTPYPDPWSNPLPLPDPTPSPYPYPLDPPSETATPDQTTADRLKETLDRLREHIQEISPAPTSTPRTETTINGEPVNNRRPSPNPIPAPTETPGTNVTINGVPETRLNPPLPDTRTNEATTVKAPTETRIDTATGTTPKTDPQTPQTPETPEKCKDPCVQGLHDKLDQKASVSLTVKVFKSCSKPVAEGQTVTPSEIETEDKIIKVPGDEADAYKLLYARLLTLESEQCGDVKAIATVPEWWQVRRGSNVPQLVILFAEVFSSGKLGGSRWSLSIPHYNRPKGARPSIGEYKKGNWFGSLKLTDGSKLGVNAASSSECKKLINRLKIHIPVEFRTVKGKALKPRIVEDPSADFKECKVTPIRGDYYSQGQANMKPDWSINLRKNN